MCFLFSGPSIFYVQNGKDFFFVHCHDRQDSGDSEQFIHLF